MDKTIHIRWKYANIVPQSKCDGATKDRKGWCYYGWVEPLVYTGEIQMHTYEWVMNKMGWPQNDCTLCLYNCLILHEKTHMELAKRIVKKWWDWFLKEIDKLPRNCVCCGDSDCDKKIKKKYAQMRANAEREIKATEEEAKKAQNECG